jgi:hypothetical protein
MHSIAANVAVIALKVKSNLPGIILENRPNVESAIPPLLIFIDHVVHWPESSLQAGSLSCSSRRQRVLMSRHQGKLAKDHAHSSSKFTLHLFQYGMKQGAWWTLEVTKLFQGDRGIRWSFDMRGNRPRFGRS